MQNSASGRWHRRNRPSCDINEHVLAEVEGQWEPAVIVGKLVDAGWGAGLGFPGHVLDKEGAEIPGYVFSSPNLQSRWDELDELAYTYFVPGSGCSWPEQDDQAL